MAESYITLREAMKSGRLSDFIAQQEAAGIGPVEEAAFLGAASKVIKHEKRANRTSRSARTIAETLRSGNRQPAKPMQAIDFTGRSGRI